MSLRARVCVCVSNASYHNALNRFPSDIPRQDEGWTRMRACQSAAIQYSVRASCSFADLEFSGFCFANGLSHRHSVLFELLTDACQKLKRKSCKGRSSLQPLL